VHAAGGGGGDRISSRESAVVDGNPRSAVGSYRQHRPHVAVSRRDAVTERRRRRGRC